MFLNKSLHLNFTHFSHTLTGPNIHTLFAGCITVYYLLSVNLLIWENSRSRSLKIPVPVKYLRFPEYSLFLNCISFGSVRVILCVTETVNVEQTSTGSSLCKQCQESTHLSAFVLVIELNCWQQNVYIKCAVCSMLCSITSDLRADLDTIES